MVVRLSKLIGSTELETSQRTLSSPLRKVHIASNKVFLIKFASEDKSNGKCMLLTHEVSSLFMQIVISKRIRRLGNHNSAQVSYGFDIITQLFFSRIFLLRSDEAFFRGKIFAVELLEVKWEMRRYLSIGRHDNPSVQSVY